MVDELAFSSEMLDKCSIYVYYVFGINNEFSNVTVEFR